MNANKRALVEEIISTVSLPVTGDDNARVIIEALVDDETITAIDHNTATIIAEAIDDAEIEAANEALYQASLR